MLALWSIAAGLLAASPEAGGRAQAVEIAESFELAWEAPQGCPDEGAMRGLIGSALFDEGSQSRRDGVRAEASVVHGKPFRLELRIFVGDAPELTLAEDDECQVLGELVALKVALALNPAYELEPEPPAEPLEPPVEEPEPEPEPSQDALDTGEIAAPPASPGRRELQTLLQLSGRTSLGLLPSIGFGLQLGAGVELGHWSSSLALSSQASPAVLIEASEGAGVRIQAHSALLSSCYGFVQGRLASRLCGTVEAAGLRARGFGLDVNTTVWRPFVGTGVETGVVWPRDAQTRFLASVGAQATLLAPRFDVAGAGEVHRAAVVMGHLSVGVEFGLGGGPKKNRRDEKD